MTTTKSSAPSFMKEIVEPWDFVMQNFDAQHWPSQPSQLHDAPPTPPASPIMHPSRPGATAHKTLPYFSPSMPIRPHVSVPAILARLRTYLDPTHWDYWPVEQHVNIKKAIEMYESGELDGHTQVWIIDGKVVSWKEVFRPSRRR